ncbi:MAG: diacylglycerol kinase [Xanthomonadales bacterium]|nr:diacylglycerol kinase [Xanthomonadales bacterium]
MQGLRAAYRHEASFRLEVYLSIILIPLGLYLGHGGVEKILLAGPMLLVMSAELLNSAIETVLDKLSPERSEMAGRAKDMGSAAVFMLMLMLGLCWLCILGPRLLAMA